MEWWPNICLVMTSTLPVCILRRPLKYSLSKTGISCCCRAWSVRVVSCHSRSFSLWERTTLSSICGLVEFVVIVATVSGFGGWMKFVPVMFIWILSSKTRLKKPCWPPPSCDGTDAAFILNNVWRELIVL